MLRFRYVPDGNSQRSRSEERVRSSSSLSGGQQNAPPSPPPPRCAATTRPAANIKANGIVSRRTSEKVREVLHPQEFVRRRGSSSPVKSDQGFSSMHQQHLSRRRKKRPIHGIKTVQVTRGRSGYGFTISGQNPCILSCIVGGSPADLAGLKAGDYLYVVNGINVSRALHDDVVRMVGQSTGTLELQVAENYNSSDSSEDDYSPRTKTRYPNRVRLRQQPAGIKQPPGMASRPLPERPTDMKTNHGRQRNHVPIGAESSVLASLTCPLSSAGDEKSHADYNEQTNAHQRAHYESIKVGKSDGRYRSAKTHGKHAENSTTDTTGEGFAFTTIQNGPVVSTAKISSGISKRPLSRAQEVQTKSINPPVSREGVIKYGHAVDGGQDLDHDENDQNVDESETEEEEGIPSVEHGTRVVVGYIGSIELPGNATRPNQRLQLLRSAVRRLRIEQKIHTLVLMEVNQGGVRLTSNAGTTIAHYSVEKLAFSGVCPDDKRFFGIVTLHSASDDVSEFSGTQEERSPSSSCHIFMVDPDMSPHMLHCHKARAFNLQCTPSPSAQRCIEFPLSPTHLILCIASLYRDRPRSKLDNEIIQSHALADPSQPAERSNSNSSNSDSGLGFGREDGAAEQVCVVDMPSGGNPTAAGSAFQPCQKGQSQLHPLLPGMPLSATRGMQRPLSAFEIRRGLNNSSSSEECWVGHRRADKLTPRAMPDPANVSLLRATSAEGLGRGHNAENLRQSMQRLLHARQQRLEQDQALSSDSESQTSSRVNTNLFSSHSAFQVPRPFSVPLQSHGRLQRGSEAVEMVDMRIGKLSPRAFKQPADILRSPSAPPIPYFPHQDSDDEDDDTESEDDPFVRKIISQFNRDRLLDLGEENPRRYSEGFALTQKRDMAWGEVAELQKWTKTGSFRRPQNTKIMSNISHSHESLVVGDVDSSQGQKLLSANSVNSILHPSPPVEDEVRCVAGWAVGFQRLLSDPDGLRIFKEFLKKEYSEENIDFWNAVETYRQIPDCDLKRVRALEIFSKYLDHNASNPVNVDSSARLFAERFFDTPTSSMFDMAQQQVFHLMRQDSYVRFLKSDLYKGLLMREMEGHSLPLANTEMPPPTGDAKKKKGKGKENEEKRRRSLLPWRQYKKSNKKISSDSELKQPGKGLDKKGKEEVKEEVNNNTKKAPGPGIDLSTMRKEVFHPRESNNAESTEQFKFCRVMMPDGSTTVVCTRPGQNIRTVLGKLCEKRALSIAAVEVFLFGSDKPLDLGEDVSTLGSKEVVIERRVLFRLDLPTHKSIGVKAKPNRSIRDVFKPILNKYGFRIDSVGVQLSGMPELLDIDIPVSDIDNQRVIIIPNERGEIAESCAEGGQASTKAAVPAHHRRTPFLLPSRIRGGKGGSLEEITNKIFDDLMKGKSELAHTFDDLGVVDLERSKGHRSTDDHRSLGLFGRLKKDTWGAKDRTKQKNKGRVTFSLPRNDARKNTKVEEDEHLMELIAHNQCQQLQAECEASGEHQARSDFLCTDAVEHVDMDAFSSLFDFRPVSIFSNDVDGSLLPPPDMFDDVQYMHSGVDGTLADFDEEFVDGAAAGDQSLQMRGGFSTFLPKRKQVTHDQTSVADKRNPYLSMHPVIVDTKMGEEEIDESPSSGPSRSLHTIFETISSHSSGANSIRAFSPGGGQWQDQVLSSSTEKNSPLLSLDNQTTSQNDPEKQQRPVPARRRLLDQNNSYSLSIIPNSQLTTSSVQDQDLTTRSSSLGSSNSPSNVNTRQSSSSIPLSRPLHPPTYSTAMGMREALGQNFASLSGTGTSLSRSQLTNTLNMGRRHSQANTSFLNENPSPAGPNMETEPVRDHRSYPLSARDNPKTGSREPLPGYPDNAFRNDKLRKYPSSGSHPSKHVATSKQQSANAVEEFSKDSIKDDPLWSRSQTPDVIASRRSCTPDVISPRRLGPTSLLRKEEDASTKSVVVAAEVHHQHHHTGLQTPVLQCNAPSYTFDTDSFSDLTVTFV